MLLEPRQLVGLSDQAVRRRSFPETPQIDDQTAWLARQRQRGWQGRGVPIEFEILQFPANGAQVEQVERHRFTANRGELRTIRREALRLQSGVFGDRQAGYLTAGFRDQQAHLTYPVFYGQWFADHREGAG